MGKMCEVVDREFLEKRFGSLLSALEHYARQSNGDEELIIVASDEEDGSVEVLWPEELLKMAENLKKAVEKAGDEKSLEEALEDYMTFFADYKFLLCKRK